MSFNGKKTAFLFPGQGAQYIGMAQDYLKNFESALNLIQKFDKDHNTELQNIMANGPEEALKETKYTQPAILFHSIQAMNELQKQIDIKPDFVAGHSLGEFSALVANGVLTAEDAMHLVHKRGEFMIQANGDKPFAMAAIIGLSPDAVKSICEEASKTDIVIAANFNTPVQTVISGSKAGVEKACELAKENKAKRIVPLVVGGPFHSPLIEKASVWLREEMDNIQFNNSEIPVVSNVDAQPSTQGEDIKDKLTQQIISSVRWVESMEYLIENGVELFIEFGPQKVLAGMMRKINRKVKVLSVDTLEDIQSVKEKLEEL